MPRVVVIMASTTSYFWLLVHRVAGIFGMIRYSSSKPLCSRDSSQYLDLPTLFVETFSAIVPEKSSVSASMIVKDYKI